METSKTKILWLGLLAGIILLILYIAEGFIFGILKTMPTPALSKFLGSYWHLWLTLGSLVVGVLIAWSYALIYCRCSDKNCLCCRQGYSRGLLFGFVVWLAGIAPLLFFIFASVPVMPPSLILILLVTGLVNLLVVGAAIGAFYGGKEEKNEN